jgi:Cu+-exporting ATPase
MNDAEHRHDHKADADSGCGCSAKAAPPTAKPAASSCCGGHGDATTKVRDPVCGMTVDPATSKHRFEHHGETFHFCSAGCRTKFAADPAKYLAKKNEEHKAPDPEMPTGTIYTCPMHPEIRRVGPGSCPICGMALEPEVASLETGPNPELADMTRRFWIGGALALPPVVLEMGGHLAGPHNWIDPTLSNWIQLVFATPVVVWAGWPFRPRLAIAGHPQPQHVHAESRWARVSPMSTA